MRALILIGLLLAQFGTIFGLTCGACRAEESREGKANDVADASYRLKPLEFPPYHSEHRVGGELVEADYIHRCGVVRMDGTGERIEFTLLPYGSVKYLAAEADMRDVPLGTHLTFFLYKDATGAFTQVAHMEDDYTKAVNEGVRYRIMGIKLETHTLLVTRQSVQTTQAGQNALQNSTPEELRLTDLTHVWLNGKSGKLNDLAVGDSLLVDFTGGSPQSVRRCADIWVGEETQRRVTEQQFKRHVAFLKARGLPAWIEKVEGNRLTVSLFSSDPASLQALFKQENIDPERWAREHRRFSVAVANEHLRTYRPPVFDRWHVVQEYQPLPPDRFGCGGVRWVLQPDLMIEGYRKGRMLRLFANPSWPVDDMPFGEGLTAGGHDEEPGDAKELLPAEFPYRTDFGNEDLPWYQLQPGRFPPDHSEHRVGGELVKVDALHRSGQFRMDRTGQLVNFSLPPSAATMLHNADVELEDLPLGMRYLFFLYQDEKGGFTRAGVVMDEFTYLATNTLTYRLESTDIAGITRDSAKTRSGTLYIARHAAPVQTDYVLEPRVPIDYGRIALEVDGNTRVWRGDKQIALTDIAVGEDLLVNLGPRTLTSRGRCTDIWVGADTHHLATEQQHQKHAAYLKTHGVPGYIDNVEGNELTIVFFAGNRKEFPPLLKPDPYGKSVRITLTDDYRNPLTASADTMGFKQPIQEGDTFDAYGCSGVRWVLRSDKIPEGYRKGRPIRLFKEDWQ